MNIQEQAVPRRIRLDLYCPAERSIYDATHNVEGMGADPRLTDAVNLLHQAKELVADFVDNVPHKPLLAAKEQAKPEDVPDTNVGNMPNPEDDLVQKMANELYLNTNFAVSCYGGEFTRADAEDYEDAAIACAKIAEEKAKGMADLLCEIAMRTNIALPETEQQMQWFEDGLIGQQNLMKQLFAALNLSNQVNQDTPLI